jgi:hypothetical protein
VSPGDAERSARWFWAKWPPAENAQRSHDGHHYPARTNYMPKVVGRHVHQNLLPFSREQDFSVTHTQAVDQIDDLKGTQAIAPAKNVRVSRPPFTIPAAKTAGISDVTKQKAMPTSTGDCPDKAKATTATKASPAKTIRRENCFLAMPRTILRRLVASLPRGPVRWTEHWRGNIGWPAAAPLTPFRRICRPPTRNSLARSCKDLWSSTATD